MRPPLCPAAVPPHKRRTAPHRAARSRLVRARRSGRETTPGFTIDPKEPGILTWKVTVPAAGKAEIALRYRIRAPRDLPLAVSEGD